MTRGEEEIVTVQELWLCLNCSWFRRPLPYFNLTTSVTGEKYASGAYLD